MRPFPRRLREDPRFRPALEAEARDVASLDLGPLRARIVESRPWTGPDTGTGVGGPAAASAGGGALMSTAAAIAIAFAIQLDVRKGVDATHPAPALPTLADNPEPDRGEVLGLDVDHDHEGGDSNYEGGDSNPRLHQTKAKRGAHRMRRDVTPVPRATLGKRSGRAREARPEPQKTRPRPRVDANSFEKDLAAYDRAHAAFSEGRLSEAVRQFRTYIEARPRGRLRLEAELNLVDALVRLGRDAESLKVVERLVSDPQARARRAELRSLGVRLKVNVGDCAGARTWILDDDPRLLAAVQRCEVSDE